MFVFEAHYYDGISSKVKQLPIRVDASGMVEVADRSSQVDFRFSIKDIDIRPRIGNTPRNIYLPNGAYLETKDNDAIDQICRHWKVGGKERHAHFFEANFRFVLLSVVAMIVIFYAGVKYGIPVASEKIAHSLPFEVDAALGENVLPELDKNFFKPSELSSELQAEITNEFENLLRFVAPSAELSPDEADTRNYKLVFRASPVIGANAFALPDGTVIMTDELVNLVGEPKYLNGILLHEIGHVKHRHSLQMLISQASFSALIVVFTGDISLASSFVLLLPSILIEAQYSRKFEYESDTYALEAMQYLNIPTEYFSIAMEKMLEAHEFEEEQADQLEVEKDETSSFFDYFSTHPPTKERIDRFRHVH